MKAILRPAIVAVLLTGAFAAYSVDTSAPRAIPGSMPQPMPQPGPCPWAW